ncbi:hypothetical protein [Halorussus amylolyticus]|uniref:hypothetical protein n=1 Tax=Halorussus amylolyticus TaxID=1126242 RepID=UPI00104FFBC9|nr:hypothetical protein [Halorussus amylolyticus]
MSERVESPESCADAEGSGESINWKRTESGVEIYDESNPEAWVRMEFVCGIDPGKRLYGVCDDCGLVAPQRGLPSASMVCGECGAEFGSDS